MDNAVCQAVEAYDMHVEASWLEASFFGGKWNC